MYDFNVIENRRNTDSLKWDIAENELPMWVADMDFQTLPQVKEALKKRADSGIYGYSIVPDCWYEAIQGWWSRRHNFNFNREWLIFCTGVVPAITCAVKRLTNHGDNVLVQTPVYNIFFHSIENTGRHVLENQLSYVDGEYQIDFNDLEKKLKNPLTTMMILCNPHNPVGKVWSKNELTRIGELCKKYNVVVLSDEIHCDLTAPGTSYTPYASASEECKENSVTCIAASKTFNLAGLQSAAVMIPNQRIREIMERGLNSDEIAEPNAFAIDGVVAAFNHGDQWVDELRNYIQENKNISQEFIRKEIKELRIVHQEATYLLWVDCSAITDDSSELCDFIRQKTGLYISKGTEYRGDGNEFIRINLACPKATVMEGLSRLKSAINEYTK